MYMSSNVILYNQLGYDARSQDNFQKLCMKVKEKVVADEMDYGLPTLAVLRRDINRESIRKDPLVGKIAEMDLFDAQISELFIVNVLIIQPYPGTARVSAK
jgi:hypothetical protein